MLATRKKWFVEYRVSMYGLYMPTIWKHDIGCLITLAIVIIINYCIRCHDRYKHKNTLNRTHQHVCHLLRLVIVCWCKYTLNAFIVTQLNSRPDIHNIITNILIAQWKLARHSTKTIQAMTAECLLSLAAAETWQAQAQHPQLTVMIKTCINKTKQNKKWRRA